MVEKWKIALKEFLKKYEEDDDVIGALLFGSYANDTYNDYSDINVYLILKDSVNYSEDGITESNSYIINYSMRNQSYIKDVMYDEYEYSGPGQVTANIFAYGKIIYDLDNKVKELQNLALEYIDKPIKNINSGLLDMFNKSAWCMMEELKETLSEENPDFNRVYYMLLDEIYYDYCGYEAIPRLPKYKIYKMLTNKEYREKNHVFKIPDKKFVDLYIKCYEENKPKIMFDNITKLLNYYYEKQGGYNIRNYRHRWERR